MNKVRITILVSLFFIIVFSSLALAQSVSSYEPNITDLNSAINFLTQQLFGSMSTYFYFFIILALLFGYCFLSYVNLVKMSNLDYWKKLPQLDKIFFSLLTGAVTLITVGIFYFLLLFILTGLIFINIETSTFKDISIILSENYLQIMILLEFMYLLFLNKYMKFDSKFKFLNTLLVLSLDIMLVILFLIFGVIIFMVTIGSLQRYNDIKVLIILLFLLFPYFIIKKLLKEIKKYLS